MKFNDVTEKDIEYAYSIYTDKNLKWDERMSILIGYFDRSERTIRKWCSEKFNFKEKYLKKCIILKNKIYYYIKYIKNW